MKLRGIDFGSVLDASGVRGFFGDGYWFHKLLSPFGLQFYGSTFVAKTTTLDPRVGNMPLGKDGITPRSLFPKCVKVKWRKGAVLNAMGLSGPGAEALFETGRWQARTEPFFLSFMAVGSTRKERKEELVKFIMLFQRYQRGFQAPMGLQMNVSCANTGHDTSELLEETMTHLECASILGIPLMPKFAITTPIEIVREITEHHACDAICVSNAIPWGIFSDEIDWGELFGLWQSPLSEFGGGALSGKPLLPMVIDWVGKAREAGIQKPINAGGGILAPCDVTALKEAGASSVFVGSIALLRGWRILRVIKHAHALFRND